MDSRGAVRRCPAAGPLSLRAAGVPGARGGPACVPQAAATRLHMHVTAASGTQREARPVLVASVHARARPVRLVRLIDSVTSQTCHSVLSWQKQQSQVKEQEGTGAPEQGDLVRTCALSC